MPRNELFFSAHKNGHKNQMVENEIKQWQSIYILFFISKQAHKSKIMKTDGKLRENKTRTSWGGGGAFMDNDTYAFLNMLA